jgi:hypothetical protein
MCHGGADSARDAGRLPELHCGSFGSPVARAVVFMRMLRE